MLTSLLTEVSDCILGPEGWWTLAGVAAGVGCVGELEKSPLPWEKAVQVTHSPEVAGVADSSSALLWPCMGPGAGPSGNDLLLS